MNIASDVKTWLESKLTLYAVMTIDNFTTAPEALMVRTDPSSAIVTEFIDGSTAGSQQLTFYARSKSPTTAIYQLDDIRKAFNQPEIKLTEVKSIRVFPLTLHVFVSKEESGESIYSMTVNVEFDSLNPVGV